MQFPLKFVFCRAYQHSQQVPIQMSGPVGSSSGGDMPEYSNLPQPRQQASLASAAAAVASSTSFNSKRSRHSSLWSLQDEQENEQDHNSSDMVNYVNDPFSDEFGMPNDHRTSFLTNSRHSASNEALN